mgnify:CR=1 FL=1
MMASEQHSGRKGNKKTMIASAVIVVFALAVFSGVLPQIREALYSSGILTSSPPEEIAGPPLSQEAWQFRLPADETNGGAFQLSEAEGEVLMLTYWASWCSTCRQTNPTLQTLSEAVRHRDDIRILMLSMDSVPDNARRYLEDARIDIPNFFPGGELPPPLRMPVIPTTYVIDKSGQIVYRNTGYENYSRPGFQEWIIELAENR